MAERAPWYSAHCTAHQRQEGVFGTKLQLLRGLAQKLWPGSGVITAVELCPQVTSTAAWLGKQDIHAYSLCILNRSNASKQSASCVHAACKGGWQAAAAGTAGPPAGSHGVRSGTYITKLVYWKGDVQLQPLFHATARGINWAVGWTDATAAGTRCAYSSAARCLSAPYATPTRSSLAC